MTDNKTIQDALAEVQRNINEAAATILDPSGKKLGTTEYQRVPGSTVGKTAVSTAGKTAGRSMLGRAASILGGPAVAGALTAAEVLKPTPAGETKSEFERQKEMGIAPKPTAGRTGVGVNKVVSRATQTPPAPAPKPAALKAATVEPKTFGQAFSAARKAAAEKGSAASGQFEFKGKTYQTNIKGEKYTPMSKQTTVSGSREVPLPPERPVSTTSDQQAPKPITVPPEATSPTPITSQPSTFEKEPKQLNFNKPESESGGKKKKMSEDTNPLIVAFLKLQENNPSNMFEAAKKAKKDYDKDGKIESPKDEVWGSRFRAAKAAGKMEEGMIDPKDPSVQGGGDVTSTPEKPAKPVAPKKVDRDPSYQGSGEVTKGGKPASVREDEQIDEVSAGLARRAAQSAFVKSDKMKADAKKEPDIHSYVQAFHKGEKKNKQGTKFATYSAKKMKEEVEEVQFSQAEIDHINSFFEQVAPGRPEPTKGVNPSVRNIDLTDENLEEVKTMSASGSHYPWMNKPKVTADAAKKSQDYYAWAKAERAKNDAAKAAAKKTTKEEVELEEHKSMDGDHLKVGDAVGFKDGHEQYGRIHSISPEGHAKVKVWNSDTGQHDHVTKHVSRLWKETNEETLKEGRPKKNPTPETTERDARQHIQVIAGRAAAGNTLDFPHNDGSKSKITPAMGRRITSHLQGLKPADRQTAVNKMHDSAEGLKV